MSVELRKYMVIHIYGITLDAANSADQYYSSYSYQSLCLIIFRYRANTARAPKLATLTG